MRGRGLGLGHTVAYGARDRACPGKDLVRRSWGALMGARDAREPGMRADERGCPRPLEWCN